MVEQLSATQDSESADDVCTPVCRHRAPAKPHTDSPKLACTHNRSQRSKLRQRARDDKFAALIGTY
jgi:hypothetical protein